MNFDPLRGHPRKATSGGERARAEAEAEAEAERASTAAACIADPPSIWQLVAYGPNAYFSKTMSGPIPPPQAAALQRGYFGAAAPPAPVAQ